MSEWSEALQDISILYHHHTVQVAQMLIQSLRLWPLKKDHRHKLQLVSTTFCASGIAPLDRKEAQQVQGAKVRASLSASQYRMQ